MCNVSLQSKNENVGHMRSVISSLYPSTQEYRLRADFTEKDYKTDNDELFSKTHKFYTGSVASKYTTTIFRIPLSDCREDYDYVLLRAL